jgi:hypothetical protein
MDKESGNIGIGTNTIISWIPIECSLDDVGWLLYIFPCNFNGRLPIG